MGWYFWIDRGGTFTDLVGVSPLGDWVVRKFLSEQKGESLDPAIKTIRDILQINDNEPIPNGIIKEVRIGTTVATNALLEGNGRPVLLFCNYGFADALFIGDQHRRDLFALEIKKDPFIAKSVIEIAGRIDSHGNEIEPLEFYGLSNNDLLKRSLVSQESCAIALLNSYRNPVHEIKLQEWLRSKGFENVICSHQVSPLPRFISRGQTTLIEATISPILFNYINKVREALGKKTTLRVMGSSGALLMPDSLQAKDTILSGPAGGMVGAVAAARKSEPNKKTIIGFDMGGTSTDVFYMSSTKGDRWQREPETEIAGYRLMAQRLPIHTVAAGGGSVIYLNGGRLQVGPRSAGSDPGPACYRKEGPLTITDANLLLGRIQIDSFPAVFGASANQSLDILVVKKRFLTLAKQLKIDPELVAEGALQIAIERMSDAIKQVSISSGYDIRSGLLVAFGGASGQHACSLAKELGINKVLLHPYSGVLSAYGIGIAPQKQFLTKHISKDLSDELLTDLKDMCQELKGEAETLLLKNQEEEEEEEAKPEACNFKSVAQIEIRYFSSDNGLMLNFDQYKIDMNSLIKSFESAHLLRFGYVPPRNQKLIIERLELEVYCSSYFESKPINIQFSNIQPKPRMVSVYLDGMGWRKIPSYERKDLILNHSIEGPALILDLTSSVFLEPGWVANLDKFGCLLLQSFFADKKTNQLTDNKSDSVLLELYRHRFTAIAVKMGERLKQTSRSVNIRERLDYSCALFDNEGSLIANAPHIPVHLGSMGNTVVELLKQISTGDRDRLKPYETVLTNDPFRGGTHLPDITAITPVFAGFERPAFYVASRGHHADIGGITPGSMPPFSRSIKDEGLLLFNETFVVDGIFDEIAWEQRLMSGSFPPRNPTVLIADLQAQVAANQLGVCELEALVNRQGYKEVRDYMSAIQVNAAFAVRKLIRSLTDSQFSLRLDNGLKLVLKLSVDKFNGKVKLDFTGTSPQGDHNFQAPLSVTKAVVLYVFRCMLDEAPLNAGCFEPIELIVPKGCLLNPTPPAAVVAGNVETSQAICNLIFGALGLLAASQGTMNNLTFGDDQNQYYETIAGGSGAGIGFHGSDGIQTHMTNSRLTDPEILEQRYPVRLEIFSIRKGSGGRGEWNGGNGLIRKIRFLAPMTVSILSGSRKIPPFGLAGGSPGYVGKNQLERIDGRQEDLDGCASLDVVPGEAIVISTPGGGGYGSEK